MFSALLAVCVLASSALPSAVVVPLQEDRLIVNVLKDAFVRHVNSSVIDPRGYRYSRCADFNLATLQLGGNPVFTTDAELDACVFKLAFYTLLFVCLCLSVSVHVRLSVCLSVYIESEGIFDSSMVEGITRFYIATVLLTLHSIATVLLRVALYVCVYISVYVCVNRYVDATIKYYSEYTLQRGSCQAAGFIYPPRNCVVNPSPWDECTVGTIRTPCHVYVRAHLCVPRGCLS